MAWCQEVAPGTARATSSRPRRQGVGALSRDNIDKTAGSSVRGPRFSATFLHAARQTPVGRSGQAPRWVCRSASGSMDGPPGSPDRAAPERHRAGPQPPRRPGSRSAGGSHLAGKTGSGLGGAEVDRAEYAAPPHVGHQVRTRRRVARRVPRGRRAERPAPATGPRSRAGCAARPTWVIWLVLARRAMRGRRVEQSAAATKPR